MLKSVIEFKVWVLFFSCGFNLIPRDCSNYIYSYSYDGDGIHSVNTAKGTQLTWLHAMSESRAPSRGLLFPEQILF